MALFKQISLALTLAIPALAAAEGDIELVENMAKLQYFTHKTALAIDHKNSELVGFYTHELEEYIEEASTVERYHGQPVGKLIQAMLVPSFEDFEAALKKGDWKKTSAQFDRLLHSCNACHDATEHGYIQIERSNDNPFMQSFKTKK